jgi:hypothetical protein
MLEELQKLHSDLKSLRRDISNEISEQIAKKALRANAEQCATLWFKTISPSLVQHHVIDPQLIEQYSSLFAVLLKLSNPNNLQSRYLEVLRDILKSFRDDLIIPIQTEPKLAKEVSALEKMLAALPDKAEDVYLKEAIECASDGHFRAAAVLGWCAAIDRIHRAIVKGGFAKFNSVSQQMTAATAGRFKRFSSPQNITTLSELREVFDSNVLWILEGMQLIDGNQHTRLRSCFELRCQCGHPGDAPVTEYNLLSFFSDINSIVLRNSAFAV